MHKMRFVPAIYNIYVCDRRHLLRDITIIAGKMDAREAGEKARRKMEELQRENRRHAVLQTLRGLSYGGKEYCTEESRGAKRSTSFHERFHARVTAAGVSKDHENSEIEDSAAYAYETFMGGADTGTIRYYRWFARQSVRFLFALDTRGQEGLLFDTMFRLAGNCNEMIAGDMFAAAMTAAQDCMFYQECLAVLRRWGPRDGERILFDAIALNKDKGPHAARQLLLDTLCERMKERIGRSYGVDLHGFRFRSLNSQKIEDETVEW